MVGGVTLNYLVIDFLRKKISNLMIPEEAPYFEALGAAIYALNNNVKPIGSLMNYSLKMTIPLSFIRRLKIIRIRLNFVNLLQVSLMMAMSGYLDSMSALQPQKQFLCVKAITLSLESLSLHSWQSR